MRLRGAPRLDSVQTNTARVGGG